MRGRHRDYMKFHDSNIINIDSEDTGSDGSEGDNEISTDSSDSDADVMLQSKPLTTVRKAREAYMFGNIEKAFIYSVIKGINVDDKIRDQIIEDEFKRIRNGQIERKKNYQFFKPKIYKNYDEQSDEA